MVGQVKHDQFKLYAKSLLPYFKDERTLFVVSSDFCHWGSRFNFTHKFESYKIEQISDSIEELDKQGMTIIEEHSLEKFEEYLDETHNTICGRNPIQLLLALINEAEAEAAESDPLNIETKFV